MEGFGVSLERGFIVCVDVVFTDRGVAEVIVGSSESIDVRGHKIKKFCFSSSSHFEVSYSEFSCELLKFGLFLG